MRFSVIASQQSTGSGERSMFSAYRLPSATALPSMSGCMSQQPFVGLQLRAARVEADPFADQADRGCCSATRTIGQHCDARIAHGIAARDREEGAAPQTLELRLAIEFEGQFQPLRKLLQQPAIGGGIQ